VHVKSFVEISGLLAPFCHFKTDDAKWLAMRFEAKHPLSNYFNIVAHLAKSILLKVQYYCPLRWTWLKVVSINRHET